MTGIAWIALVATGLIAAVDWYAVGTGRQRLEDVAKPLTMVALIGVAVSLDDVVTAARTWHVVALVLCMLGDIFLLRDRFFVQGLASFLLGHVAYIVGLRYLGTDGVGLALAAAIVAVALPLLARPILRSVRGGDEPELFVPVVAYIVVISAMVLAAGASGTWLALAGALSFYSSDALIAWNKFIEQKPWGRLAIITTYHLGQVGLVLALTMSG